jgi:hypothetical protein
VLCAWQYSQNGVQPNPIASLLIVAVVGLLVAFTVRKMFWFLADEVVLGSGALRATRGGHEVSLAAADIVDVITLPFNLRHAVALMLRNPVAPFGRRVVFLPLGWKHSSREQIDELVMLLRSQLR